MLYRDIRLTLTVDTNRRDTHSMMGVPVFQYGPTQLITTDALLMASSKAVLSVMLTSHSWTALSSGRFAASILLRDRAASARLKVFRCGCSSKYLAVMRPE